MLEQHNRLGAYLQKIPCTHKTLYQYLKIVKNQYLPYNVSYNASLTAKLWLLGIHI